MQEHDIRYLDALTKRPAMVVRRKRVGVERGVDCAPHSSGEGRRTVVGKNRRAVQVLATDGGDGVSTANGLGQ